MSHVTTTLQDLQAEMNALLRERDRVVKSAEAAIREANREFDRQAVPLGKRIRQLQEQEELSSAPRATTRSRKPPSPSFDGLEPDEVEHYKALLARKATR